MDKRAIAKFQKVVWDYYQPYGRHVMLWRRPEPDGSFDPYKIMVSELMLQQTQVARVTPKFVAFLKKFPTVQALATAPLGEVLQLWSGLGYNRRAKFLWQAARKVTLEWRGTFPTSTHELQKLSGIGLSTAGAIAAYAFNQPVIFAETNIRTAVIHHFFADQTGITDSSIREILGQVIDHTHPREFYWALTDYGAYIKRTVGNLNTLSKSYTKQSAFSGSKRQIRGELIRLLTIRPYRLEEIEAVIPDKRLRMVAEELVTEGFIQQDNRTLRLS